LRADPSIGALGGPVLGSDGTLIEAGRIIWGDGSRTAYLHGAPAQVSEAGFVRDADMVSDTQLLLLAPLLRSLGGFAADLDDAEAEADLAIRIWRTGYRVRIDPAMAVRQPGARTLRTAGLAQGPSAALRARHGVYLSRRPAPGSLAEHVARTPRQSVEAVLILTPSLPGPVETIVALSAAGAAVTVYPLDGGPADPVLLPSHLPEGVEIICGPGAAGLEAFRSARGPQAFSRVVEG
jgi:hypothetical protein